MAPRPPGRPRPSDLHCGPRARHGHKTAARASTATKGHIALDPDNEIITDTGATAGNAGNASATPDLIDDILHREPADGADADEGERPTVYGDNAYGTGELHDLPANNDITDRFKT